MMLSYRKAARPYCSVKALLCAIIFCDFAPAENVLFTVRLFLDIVNKMPRRRANSTDNSPSGSSTSSSSSFIDVMQLQHHPLHVHPISEDDDEMSSDEYGHQHSDNDDGEISSNSSSRCSPPLLRQSVSLCAFTSSRYNLPNMFQSDDGPAPHEHLDDRSCPFGSPPELLPSSCSNRYNGNQYLNALVFTARRRQNPLMFATMSAFVFMGVFLYTKSYATLHGALEQVTILMQERRQVHIHFQSVENDIQQLQRQLFELDQTAGVWSFTRSGDARMGSSTTSSATNPRSTEQNADSSDRGSSDQSTENTRAYSNENSSGKNRNAMREDAMFGEMVTLQEKLREGSSQIGNLQKHVQEMSKRDALEKYGGGVIRVQLELEFPKDVGATIHNGNNNVGGPTTIILEMAPIDVMPHSVYMFLEMVHAGLFDGCSFILNAMHVIKAAPLPYDGSSASQKVKAFTKRGLETVAFREYSPDFPHDQYTVGFAADGSPSFYINTQDNSQIHVGEPCFAKIISGFDTVERLEAAPTRNGIWYRRRIGLKRATIL
jgi:cyclophilin family peptidyl-prolyl cis-trans isomerase